MVTLRFKNTMAEKNGQNFFFKCLKELLKVGPKQHNIIF